MSFDVLKGAANDVLGYGVTGDKVETEIHWLYMQEYLDREDLKVPCAKLTEKGLEVVKGINIVPGVMPPSKCRKLG
ncbi:hypothetical protein [Cellvibrio sp. PSBB023]|uniref:hypothetical protein n=1 Tax=Cellvibrio sp. PSBB023 TaxID=1945512 RepID=UPI00122E28D1|nr:hypothetical protein [Cellvibrio sp. PSBB023]